MRRTFTSLPCIFFRSKSNVAVRCDVYLTVLGLDSYPKQLDVLGRICTHPRVVLVTESGRKRKKPALTSNSRQIYVHRSEEPNGTCMTVLNESDGRARYLELYRAKAYLNTLHFKNI